MKDILLTVFAQGTAQEYYKAIYSDAVAFQTFHREHTKDPTATVSLWECGQRSVQFCLALNVPKMLTSIIGADSIKVVEVQRISWQGTDKFTINSEPQLDFPGSSKFTTKGTLTVTSLPDGSCKVEQVLVCNAAMPWPMQGTVEATMASEAKVSVTKFLDFCVRTSEQYQAQKRKPTSSSDSQSTQFRDVAVDEDGNQFFDAQEDEWTATSQQLPRTASTSTQSSRGGQTRPGSGHAAPLSELEDILQLVAVQPGLGRSGGASTVHGQGELMGISALQLPSSVVPGSSEEFLLLALQHMQSSGIESSRAMADMAEQIRTLNESIQAIRKVVAPTTGDQRPGPHAGTTTPGPSAGSTSSMLWFLAGAAVATGAVAVYVRSRQRGSPGAALL